MKKWIIALLSVSAMCAAVPTPAQEKEIMAALDAWIQATAKQDIPALRKVLHDELWYSHSAATFQNKEEVIKDVEENRGPIGMELSDVRVRIYGNVAHVKAMTIVRNRPRNPPAATATTARPGPSPLLIVHMLVKGPEGWQVVSRQATRPTPPPPAR